MKPYRITRESVLIAALAAAAAPWGCVPRAMAPRIPAFKAGPAAPYGDELIVPETTSSMLREAPDDVKQPEFVK